MVMPRSRSRSISSRICSLDSRSVIAPARMSRRSDKVLLPWSMCAMIEKFRICMRQGKREILGLMGVGDKWADPFGGSEQHFADGVSHLLPGENVRALQA